MAHMKGNMTLMKGNMALMKGNMALTKGNMALRHVRKSWMKHCSVCNTRVTSLIKTRQ